MSLKVALLTGSLRNRGGVERVVLHQAKALKADIIAGRYNSNTTYEEFKKLNVKTLISEKSSQRIGAFLLRHKFSKLKEKYDFFIFHGGVTLEAAKNNKPNLWYCHSPTRYLYDLYDDELKKQRGLKRRAFKKVTSYLRKRDQKNVRQINTIVVNSENVKKRVKKYYNRSSDVVYPFVDLNKFKWILQGDFYLSTARLDPIKRVDLLVRAFEKMPDKNLIIASSGPEYSKLKKMSENKKNIAVLGRVSDKKLIELYGKCIATFSVSYKEDFGMVPLESMACGKPCIATNTGGHKETIIDKKTGELINPENIGNIVDAVKKMSPENAKKMRKACEKRAEEFSLEKHLTKLKKAILETK